MADRVCCYLRSCLWKFGGPRTVVVGLMCGYSVLVCWSICVMNGDKWLFAMIAMV